MCVKLKNFVINEKHERLRAIVNYFSHWVCLALLCHADDAGIKCLLLCISSAWNNDMLPQQPLVVYCHSSFQFFHHCQLLGPAICLFFFFSFCHSSNIINSNKLIIFILLHPFCSLSPWISSSHVETSLLDLLSQNLLSSACSLGKPVYRHTSLAFIDPHLEQNLY